MAAQEDELDPAPRALSDIRVFDCSNLVAGPAIGMILGDFGAEVIKIEYPGMGDGIRQWGARKNGQTLYWKYIARNKKLITLALNKPEGQQLFLRLLEAVQPDVMIENFRPGTLEKWNLGPEKLQVIDPKLVLIRVTGFGQTGPYKSRPGFGTLAEAMSGFAHLTGQPDGPPTLPQFAMADTIAALYSTIGALIAIHARRVTGGRGQVIDAALLEGIFSMFPVHLMEYDQLKINPGRIGSRVLTSSPRNIYETRDGGYVAIAAAVDSIVGRLFRVMKRPEMLTDARFSTNQARLMNADALDEIIGDWVKQFSQDEVLQMLNTAEVSVAPVLDIAKLHADPHLIERQAIIEVADPELGPLTMHAPLPRLSLTPGRVDFAGPVQMGTDNEEIYVQRLGLSTTELADFKAREII